MEYKENLKIDEEYKGKINKLNKEIQRYTLIVFLEALIMIVISYFCWQTITCDNTGGGMTTEEIPAFNSRIAQYCGKNKRASEVNNLLDVILALNATQDKEEESERHYVQIDISDENLRNYIQGEIGNETLISTNMNFLFKNNTTYNVDYKTGDDGYIYMVIITSNQ